MAGLCGPSRRSVLRSVPLLATGLAAPGFAGATTGTLVGTVDPHIAWLARWTSLLDYINGPLSPKDVDADELPEWHELLAIEEQLSSVEARTIAGARAQLRFLWRATAEFSSVSRRTGPTFAAMAGGLDRLVEETPHG